jgi:hypothetical protein
MLIVAKQFVWIRRSFGYVKAGNIFSSAELEQLGIDCDLIVYVLD